MDFEKIVGMWSEDCHIDSTELAREDLNTPVVHNKYLKIFSGERIALFKLKAKVKQTKRMLMEYYSGDLNDPETLDDVRAINKFLDRWAFYIRFAKQSLGLNLKILEANL